MPIFRPSYIASRGFFPGWFLAFIAKSFAKTNEVNIGQPLECQRRELRLPYVLNAKNHVGKKPLPAGLVKNDLLVDL